MSPPTLIQSRSASAACSAGVHAGALVMIVAAFFALPAPFVGVATADAVNAKNAHNATAAKNPVLLIRMQRPPERESDGYDAQHSRSPALEPSSDICRGGGRLREP